jgi:hypothetical protein
MTYGVIGAWDPMAPQSLLESVTRRSAPPTSKSGQGYRPCELPRPFPLRGGDHGLAEQFGGELGLHRRRQGRKAGLAVLDPPRFEGFVFFLTIGAAEKGGNVESIVLGDERAVFAGLGVVSIVFGIIGRSDRGACWVRFRLVRFLLGVGALLFFCSSSRRLSRTF